MRTNERSEYARMCFMVLFFSKKKVDERTKWSDWTRAFNLIFTTCPLYLYASFIQTPRIHQTSCVPDNCSRACNNQIRSLRVQFLFTSFILSNIKQLPHSFCESGKKHLLGNLGNWLVNCSIFWLTIDSPAW